LGDTIRVIMAAGRLLSSAMPQTLVWLATVMHSVSATPSNGPGELF
jgi:hypothetical protein